MVQVLTAAQADTAWGAGCKPRGLTTVKFDGLLFTWINDAGAVEALEALSSIITRHDYEIRPEDTGTYNCRFIKGTSTLSRHAKPIAIDVNWKSNPDGSSLVTDLPVGLVVDAVALRTNSGEQVWRWGGDWDTRPETPHGYYDAMHFELIAHPVDLATGLTLGDDDMIPMWTKDLNEAGWRNLAREGIAAGGEANVVDYWVTKGAQRTNAEHQAASINMFPQLLARAARITSGAKGDTGPRGPAGAAGATAAQVAVEIGKRIGNG